LNEDKKVFYSTYRTAGLQDLHDIFKL
jgi:hypothetical protein